MDAEALVFLLRESTLAGSAATLCVLALRNPWQRLFGAAMARWPWLAVPFASLAPLLPAPVVELELPVAAMASGADLAASAAALPAAATGSGLSAWVLAAWLAGMAAFALRFSIQQARFGRGLRATVRRVIQHSEDASAGPAVLGLLRPRIVLPAAFAQRHAIAERRLILAHEIAHLRGGDVWIAAFASLMRCVFWFNPLVHVAARRLRRDQELAADAQVLRRRPDARRRYGAALLNAQLAVPGLPAGCLWQSGHPLKERIMALSLQYPSPARRRMAALLAASLGLGAGFATWAAQPPQTAVVPSQAHANPAPPDETEPPDWALTLVDFHGVSQTPLQIVTQAVAATGKRLEGTQWLKMPDDMELTYAFNRIPLDDVLRLVTTSMELAYGYTDDAVVLAPGAPAKASIVGPDGGIALTKQASPDEAPEVWSFSGESAVVFDIDAPEFPDKPRLVVMRVMADRGGRPQEVFILDDGGLSREYGDLALEHARSATYYAPKDASATTAAHLAIVSFGAKENATP